ncbi:hypothetical protein PVAG01_01734 [Phlyctema vagabunda]|uniref:BRCT domain-containing protein n=1 Tax=Phlyctema vagabunda TaxID=108571 RepID=A0ABR4PYE8_9HELO
MPAIRRQSSAKTNKTSRVDPISRAGRKKRGRSKVCKPIFNGTVISLAGNFTTTRGDQWNYDKIRSWITHHSGQYVVQVTGQTTHLICTIAEFQAKTQQVRAALALGRKCEIVTEDWLEDCLIRKKAKKLPVTDYKLSRVLKRIRAGQAAREPHGARFEEGVQVAASIVQNRKNPPPARARAKKTWKSAYLQQGLYHVYYDDEGFEYKVVLTKLHYKGFAEKYTIYLFQSHAIPRLYMCAAKFSRPSRENIWYELDPQTGRSVIPTQFSVAWANFKFLFQNKTGVEWDDRLEGKWLEDKFVYAPPKLGRPVGALPYGYVRPEEREMGGERERPVKQEDVTDSSGDAGLLYETDSEVDDSDDVIITKVVPRKRPAEIEDVVQPTKNVEETDEQSAPSTDSAGEPEW